MQRRRSLHACLAGVICAASVLLAPEGARAQEGARVAIVWDAPAGCPAPAEVRARVDGLLGGPADERARGALTVSAKVARGERWTVTLDTIAGDSTGHRSIEATSCDGLASATALIVALMIDPDAVAARAQAQPEPAKAEPPPPAPEVPPAATPRPLRATFGLVSAGGTGHVGVLPAPDVGLGVGVGLLTGPWRFELRGAYHPRRIASDPIADASAAYGRFRFVAGTLAACRMGRGMRFQLGGCAQAEVGAVLGEGAGGRTNASKATPWVGVGAGGVVVFAATSWLRFPLHVDAIVPLWRPDYVFEGAAQPVFRSAAVGARVSLTAEAQF